MIQFEQRAKVAARSPNRADVALFVGAVARRMAARVDPVHPAARASDPLYRWLEAERWTIAAQRREQRPLEELLDVPVPIESFAEFDRLFAWERRPLGPSRFGTTYLGAAVRAFFEEGGRRCYVVRVCDPWPSGQPGDAARWLIPSEHGRPTGNAFDRSSWRGLWHLYGLPEVSFACAPDLPEVCAPPPPAPRPLPVPPAPPERFVECTPPLQARTEVPELLRSFRAPRCDGAGYARWAAALRAALEGIERAEPTTSLREVQLVAAIPLPAREALPEAERDVHDYLRREHGLDSEAPSGLASPFLQLVYPWLRTAGSGALPEGLESPEGALVGLLARNALSRGTFQSAAGLPSYTLLDLEPRLRKHELSTRLETAERAAPDIATAVLDDAEQLARTPWARDSVSARTVENLVRRVSLFGESASGPRLLSDVSTARDVRYRQAHVRRLLVAVIRAARSIGESSVFEASEPALWEALVDHLSRMLRGLWRAGALAGAREADAFGVRCDRSTMSQADIDAGRVIAVVELAPAPAIERIIVSLSLEGGSVSGGPATSTRAA